MNVAPSLAGINPLPSAPAPAAPEPPLRWARWWTSPIARLDYGAGSILAPWPEAHIPAERGLTGARRPSLAFGGHSQSDAEAAARLLAATPVVVTLQVRGRERSVRLHPAIAVLRDARAGTYWLAPLRTSIRSGEEWVDIPHSIDGAAFAGRSPLLQAPRVASATREMVSVVGRDAVITPSRWYGAPSDSVLRP